MNGEDDGKERDQARDAAKKPDIMSFIGACGVRRSPPTDEEKKE